MAAISDLLLNAVGFSQNTRWRSEDLEFRGVRTVQVGLRSEFQNSIWGAPTSSRHTRHALLFSHPPTYTTLHADPAERARFLDVKTNQLKNLSAMSAIMAGFSVSAYVESSVVPDPVRSYFPAEGSDCSLHTTERRKRQRARQSGS